MVFRCVSACVSRLTTMDRIALHQGQENVNDGPPIGHYIMQALAVYRSSLSRVFADKCGIRGAKPVEFGRRRSGYGVSPDTRLAVDL